MKPLKIALITGSRADYGLLRSLALRLSQDPEIKLEVWVTGSHLSPKFGETWKEIEKDSLPISVRVPVLETKGPMTSDSVCKSVARGIEGFSKACFERKPDLTLLLGDRYEILASGWASYFHQIPIAHIHGGETTVGSWDEAIRHSLTKIAHLHFTSTEAYRKRVIQLGEKPSNVFSVGAVGIDALEKVRTLSEAEFFQAVKLPSKKPFFLVTLHSSTMEKGDAAQEIRECLKALDAFSDATILFTGTNADPGGNAIRTEIESYIAKNPKRARLIESLGSDLYWNAMRYADLVIGNSSSGIIEAPAVHVPTIDIGSRQDGRIRGESVIHVEASFSSIRDAMTKGLSPAFREKAKKSISPYGKGGASEKIAKILKTTDFAALGPKKFHDLEGSAT